MPATENDTLYHSFLPSICRKKVTAAFDGDRSVPTVVSYFLAGAELASGQPRLSVYARRLAMIRFRQLHADRFLP